MDLLGDKKEEAEKKGRRERKREIDLVVLDVPIVLNHRDDDRCEQERNNDSGVLVS